MLAEVDAPGGSVSEVARRHALHTSLLFRWRRDLTKRKRAAPASAAQSFMPVRLPPPALPAPPAPARSGSIEIELAGGRMLRVGADVEVGALMRIVEALEGAR